MTNAVEDGHRVAIITAAGRGIGAACARELSRLGYKVGLLSLSGNAERLASALGGFGLSGSVAVEADLKSLVDGAMERWGRIDAVVNNSSRVGALMVARGYGLNPVERSDLTFNPDSDIPIDALPDTLWHDAFDLFYLNVVRMCRLVTPLMIQQGGGAIVNISSNDVLEPKVAFPLSPIRGAMHAYAKMYADRFGPHGIRMNTVAPGMLESFEMSSEDVKALIPKGKLGSVESVARTVAFLLSKDAEYISGQILRVDGAMNRSV